METPRNTATVRTPVAPRVPVTTELHGTVRSDDYSWLRERDNPGVIAHLAAENEYMAAYGQRFRELEDAIYGEMLGRIKQTDTDVPDRKDDYFYYNRTVEGLQYPIFARRCGSLDAPEEILLDRNGLAGLNEYFSTGVTLISPDHRYLAYTVDRSGAEYFTLHVKDLSTGETLPDRIERVHFSVAWAADNRHLFYTTTDAAQRPDRVMRHRLGTDASQDSEVFHDSDPLFRVSINRTKNDRFLLLTSTSFTSSEVHVLEANDPTGDFRLVEPRAPDVQYRLEHQRGRFLVHTNLDAVNFRLMEAPEAAPARHNWREVVPEREGVLLDSFDVFADHIVLHERSEALRRIRVIDCDSRDEHLIAFNEDVYTASPGPNPEYDSATLRFTYQSLVTPRSVYDYDMRTRSLALLKRTEVLGGYDSTQYESTREWARAADGSMIPISLVYRTPLQQNGSRPLLLYAYGSYGSSSDPTFNANNVSLLDRGVIYAIAHVRGGQEMGRPWYDDGKMRRKLNTFTDFIAAAEHLIERRYTTSDRLAIRGGSAGGLLVGAVLNMRPELFRVAVADVPFVDVINTMLDASIPLTTGEWEQWGNPAVEDDYDYMVQYSPYDNVRAQRYPAMLVTTGLNDPRVAFWEPAKWVAKLRAMKTDNNVLLLRTNMGAGHGGSSGRYDALREIAFRYAFILHTLDAVSAG